MALSLPIVAAAQSSGPETGPPATAPAPSPPQPLELGETIVTGAPAPGDPFTTASDVDALFGAEKRRRQRTSLGASLDHLAGVSNVATGSQVGKPVIRGLSGNRVRVLSDGIATNFQQFGVRHPPNVDPFMAERIEVVRGASSVLYGSDALGGAVNVIPHWPVYGPEGGFRFGGRATTRFESADESWTHALSIDAAQGNLGLAGDLTYRDGNELEVPDVRTFAEGDTSGDAPGFSGELPFTGYEQLNGHLALGFRTDFGEIKARYTRFRNEHDFLLPPPPFPGGGGPGVDGVGQRLENDVVQLKGEIFLGETWTLEPSVTYARNLRLSEGRGDTRPIEEGDAAIDVLRKNVTGRVELKHDRLEDLPLEGTLGLEVAHEAQESRGPVGLTPGGTVDNVAVFAFEKLDLDPLFLEAGIRLDHRAQEADPGETRDPSLLDRDGDGRVDVDLENTYTEVTGSLGATYRLTDALALAANVGRGFRAPDLFELYVNGVHGGVAAVQRGDPDLSPESSLNSDLSLRFRSARVRAKATVYRNAIDNFVFPADTRRTQGGLPIFDISQDDAVLYGGDVSVEADVLPYLRVRGTWEAVRGELDSSGDDVPLLPEDQLTLEARLHGEALGPVKDPYFSVGVRYAASKDAAGSREPFAQFDNAPFGTASTDAHTLLDLGAGFSYAGVALSVKVENVLDEEYRGFLDTYKGYALSPGRNVIASLSYEF